LGSRDFNYRLDPAKNFGRGFNAGENRALMGDDSRSGSLIFRDEKISGHVAVADVFAQSDIDWIDVLLRFHQALVRFGA
jgi:hypothetical protein